MTQTELEEEYLSLANEVENRLLKIIGLCGANRADDAGSASADLMELVGNRRNQIEMQKETAGNYDLAALAVEPGTLTNSETAYEREE